MKVNLTAKKPPGDVIVEAKELGQSKHIEGQLRFSKTVRVEERDWQIFGCSI